MAHAEAHPNPNPHDDPSAEPVLFVGVIGTIIFVATVVFVSALAFAWTNQTQNVAYINVGNQAASRAREQQEMKLQLGYRWLDDERTRVSLPIDHAMGVVAAELKAGKGGGSAGR